MVKTTDNISIAYNNCFLCGVLLNSQNKTEEHVYPKWLQHRYNLWNKSLVLLNGTSIQYKKLYIPCCKECNHKLNINVEIPFRKAVEKGYSELIKLNEKVIFLWLAKLSYGIMYKELSLKLKLNSKQKGSIVTEKLLMEFESLHLFLQSIIYNMTFSGNPWSIMIFKVHTDDMFENYDVKDFIVINNIFIQLGDIGIVANLHDNGCNKRFFLENNETSRLLEKELHPLQFNEVCAKFFYKSTLFYRNPAYVIVNAEDGYENSVIISVPINGLIYNEWNQKDYAKYLAMFWKPWGALEEELYKEGKVFTVIYNEDGSFKSLDQFL